MGHRHLGNYGLGLIEDIWELFNVALFMYICQSDNYFVTCHATFIYLLPCVLLYYILAMILYVPVVPLLTSRIPDQWSCWFS